MDLPWPLYVGIGERLEGATAFHYARLSPALQAALHRHLTTQVTLDVAVRTRDAAVLQWALDNTPRWRHTPRLVGDAWAWAASAGWLWACQLLADRTHFTARDHALVGAARNGHLRVVAWALDALHFQDETACVYRAWRAAEARRQWHVYAFLTFRYYCALSEEERRRSLCTVRWEWVPA